MMMFRLPFYLIIILFSQLSNTLCTDSDAFETRIFHRLLDPYADPAAEFTERGTLYYNGTDAWIKPSPRFTKEIESFTVQGKGEQALSYQVALGSSDPERAAISSAKACHLRLAPTDYLTLHVDAHGEPFSLSYFLSSVPLDGRCTKGSKFKPGAPLTIDTTIVIQKPTYPPKPELRPPPQAVQTKNVQEKSFLQKYWFYIAIAVLALVMTGGGPEEGAGTGGGQASS